MNTTLTTAAPDSANAQVNTSVALFQPFQGGARKAPTFREWVTANTEYASDYEVTPENRLKFKDNKVSKLAHARYDAIVRDQQAKDKAVAAALVSAAGNHVAAIRGNKAGNAVTIQLKLDKAKKGAKSPELIAAEERIAKLEAELAARTAAAE